MEITQILLALVTLTAMEIVLGIDNIVFIAIITSRLPVKQQPKARRTGLALAMVMRIALLLTLSWILHLTDPIFHLTDIGIPADWLSSHEEANNISWRDLILLAGGLFLIGKSVLEIHAKIEGDDHTSSGGKPISFVGVIAQIAILDIVFSLDSVITAVGMAEDLWVMIAAVIAAVVVMMIFAEKVSRFVEHNPTIKMLALSFLILIGVMLVADGVGTPISKGYIYFAMAFALIVEFLNLRLRSKHATAESA